MIHSCRFSVDAERILRAAGAEILRENNCTSATCGCVSHPSSFAELRMPPDVSPDDLGVAVADLGEVWAGVSLRFFGLPGEIAEHIQRTTWHRRPERIRVDLPGGEIARYIQAGEGWRVEMSRWRAAETR